MNEDLITALNRIADAMQDGTPPEADDHEHVRRAAQLLQDSGT